MAVQQIGDGGPDGTKVFQSGEKGGFFGATPIVHPTGTQMVTPVLSQVATSGKWAFSNSTAAYLIFTRLRAYVTKLDALGLINV